VEVLKVALKSESFLSCPSSGSPIIWRYRRFACSNHVGVTIFMEVLQGCVGLTTKIPHIYRVSQEERT